MADRLKPENAEIVERIRRFEDKMFRTHDFKLYRNYHVPEQLIKNSKTVLSFGVGGDAHFEKLICHDNPELDVRMFDPTPWTVANIGGILSKGGHKLFRTLDDGNKISKRIVQKNLKFKPYAYAPNNGKMKFYYKEEEDAEKADQVLGCFSLVDAFDQSSNFVEVDCKNIDTILQELGWSGVDILKTDVEGLWYDVGKEIKNLDVKYWVTEIEMNVGTTYDEAFDKVSELVALHEDKYNVYRNRVRLKPMMELIFYRKDIDES